MTPQSTPILVGTLLGLLVAAHTVAATDPGFVHIDRTPHAFPTPHVKLPVGENPILQCTGSTVSAFGSTVCRGEGGCNGITILIGSSGECHGRTRPDGDGGTGCDGVILILSGDENCQGADGKDGTPASPDGKDGGDGCKGTVVAQVGNDNCHGGGGGSGLGPGSGGEGGDGCEDAGLLSVGDRNCIGGKGGDAVRALPEAPMTL